MVFRYHSDIIFDYLYIKPENVRVSRVKNLCVRLCCAMILTISAFFCNVSVTVASVVGTNEDRFSVKDWFYKVNFIENKVL